MKPIFKIFAFGLLSLLALASFGSVFAAPNAFRICGGADLPANNIWNTRIDTLR